MENLENEPRGRSKSIERRKRNRKAEEKSDPRKGLDASRMTSRCKRIGMILFWNKKVTTVSRNWSRTYSITCIANRSTKITRIYEKSLRLLIVEKWNENSRSYDRRISSQQNRTSFIKMEHRLESQLGKELNHITEWKLQFRKYIIFLVKEYNKKYHLRYY